AFCADSEAAGDLDAALRRAEDPGGLPALLEGQPWRLTFWRDDERARNYRRFFDIDQLAAIRAEREEVFEAIHALPFAAVASGAVDGVRVDYPDRLRDPAGYLERLRARLPDAWIVVEKILEPGERVRENWPVDGLTGYDFLDTVSGVLTDPDGAEGLREAWAQFAGEPPDWPDLVHDCKRAVAQAALAPELDRIARMLDRCRGGRGSAANAPPDPRGPALAQREALE